MAGAKRLSTTSVSSKPRSTKRDEALVRYSRVPPTVTGVYACRVPMIEAPSLSEDLFLMWYEGDWYYLRSDQRCRREVLGWVGPLERKLK